MRRNPRRLRGASIRFFAIAATLLAMAASSLEAQTVADRSRRSKKTEQMAAPKKEEKKDEKAEPQRVRTSAIRDRGASVRYVNRRGQTEVEVTPAINRENLSGRESVIQRRDDGSPTIVSPPPVVQAEGPEIIIDIKRQRLRLMRAGKQIKEYEVSTSRFGIGDRYHSYKTPVGKFKVDGKIGGRLPKGAVLKQGRFTGEILQPNAPGRDPIVTRVIRLRGMEARNANAFGRGIFIHGTPDEKRIGKPVSFGCVRMRSDCVVDLYARIGDGTTVTILHPDESPAPVRGGWFANLFGGSSGGATKASDDSGS